MWNEQNWTLVSMPVTSTRAQWDEGLRTVRQFNDLLRVLPPTPQTGAGAAAAAPPARRAAAPGRPVKPAATDARYAQPRTDANRSDPAIRRQPPRNGRQSPHYQR
jgi:hypothetical protein